MSYTLKQNFVRPEMYGVKCPYPMTPVGIIVHNTAGARSAMTEVDDMINNGNYTSYHVACDEHDVVEAIPFNRNAWHAGDGAGGFGNRNLIGIEICRSKPDDNSLFPAAEENAAEYIAYVCIQFGWTSDQLHQHNWYAQTACPHRTKGHWEEFKQKVDAKIKEVQSGVDVKAAELEQIVTVALHGYARDIRGENKDGTVYVAIRDLLNQMGYNVDWDGKRVLVEYKK
ncbi:MAG: N-acetylmuramoyl-L-alanine amidase [Clostridiales bacterium]|nr:N-acetylmuramoyl-L-alanine amidase [Clostridiales bacterium]